VQKASHYVIYSSAVHINFPRRSVPRTAEYHMPIKLVRLFTEPRPYTTYIRYDIYFSIYVKAERSFFIKYTESQSKPDFETVGAPRRTQNRW